MVGTLLPPVGIWPALAASNNKKPAPRPPAAERCRQLAAAWLGDGPGITFNSDIDTDLAIPACKQAVKMNPTNADLKAYLCRALRRDWEQADSAQNLCLEAAKAGSPAGMTSLGEALEEGQASVRLDEALGEKDQAIVLFHRAAEQGYPPAQNNLGVRFFKGDGVTEDKEQAVAWFRKAAEQGYWLAQSNLGVMYAFGRGVKKDETQAIAWFSKAGDHEALGGLRAIEPLAADLRSVEPEDRESAARALGKAADDPQVVELLVGALQDKDASVRTAAANALNGSGLAFGKQLADKGSRAVEPLIAALRDKDPSVRTAVVEALGALADPRAVEPLIAALRDKDPSVREAVEKALNGDISDIINDISLMETKETDWLLTVFKSTNAKLRRMAVSALGRKRDSRAVGPLITALQDKDASVRTAVVEALGALADPRAVEPLVAALRDPNIEVRLAAISILDDQAYLQAVEPLIAALQDKDASVRTRAAEALGKLQDFRAVEPLIAALQDTDPNYHQAVIKALENLPDSRWVNLLIKTLSANTDPGNRIAAIRILAHLYAPRAVKPLIAVLQDKDASVRTRAAEALGELQDPRAVEPLIAALQDKGVSTRNAAASALGKLRDPRAVEPLIAALKDEDESVQDVAAYALGELRDPRAVEPLVAALHGSAHNAAASALGELRDPRAVEPLLADLQETIAERVTLTSSTASVFKVVDESFDAGQSRPGTGESEGTDIVVKALGQFEDPRVADPLIAILSSDDSYGETITEAMWSLGKSKDPRAVELLIANLKRSVDSDATIEALVTSAPLGLADNRVATTLRGYGLNKLTFLLSSIPYTRMVLEIIHLSTTGITYSFKLETLGQLWQRDNRQVVPDTVLENDFAALRANSSDEAVDANPYLALFVARLHQEQGRNDAALAWIERARSRLPAHEIAPQIVLGWIEAEALKQAGRSEQARVVINQLEHELIPRLAGVEHRVSKLPFWSQTLALKGILLGELGQRQAGIEALYAATKARTQEQQLGWITGATGQEVQQVISGFQATLLDQESKALAEESLKLAKQTAPTSRLGQEAELKALESRLRAALGEGDVALAQHLTEQWLLKQQVVPPGLGGATNDRQRTIQRLRDLQNRLQQLAGDQDAAEQAVQRAAGRLLAGNDTGKVAAADPAEAQRKLADIQAQRAQARQALTDFMHALKAEHLDLAALYGAEPQELSRLQSRLHPDQRLVQYLLLDDQGWAFVASATQLQVIPLGVGRRQLRDTIDRYRELLQLSAAKRGFTLTPDAAPAVGPAGRATELARNLSAVLLEPLRPHLGEAQHLLLVPNGPLHRLPFAALPWDGGFLIRRFRLSTLSSASLLTALPPATSAAVPHLVALADATPDAPLPEAAAEAQAIAQHFSEPDIYLHDQARRDRLLGQDLSGRILHLAVHGQASTPDRTRLRLSDGDLTYSDVTGLRLDAAPLVVLSACETGLGTQLSGDEVVSLANGFISAGARAVVSSLWPVPDPETKQLMQTFYDHRIEGHAAALAAAQRALIAQSRDPYYWAGFVVGGW